MRKGLGNSVGRNGGLSIRSGRGGGGGALFESSKTSVTGFGKTFNSDKLSLFNVFNASAAASRAGSAFFSSSSQSSCFSLT